MGEMGRSFIYRRNGRINLQVDGENMEFDKPERNEARGNDFDADLNFASQRTGVPLCEHSRATASEIEEFEHAQLAARVPAAMQLLSSPQKMASNLDVLSIFAVCGIFFVACCICTWRFAKRPRKTWRMPGEVANRLAIDSKEIRLAIAISLLWILVVQLWGYIWRWESEFTQGRFYVLNSSIPILTFAGVFLKRWVSASKR
jgi:hypothetical protein